MACLKAAIAMTSRSPSALAELLVNTRYGGLVALISVFTHLSTCK